MKLTETGILMLTVEPGRKDRLVFDDEQPGLGVRVGKSARAGKPGGRRFVVQYSLNGQKPRIPLGSCSAVPLAAARNAAAVVMGDLARGKNPSAERKQAEKAERARRARNRLSLRVLIADWQRLRLAERRASYAKESVRALHSAFADHLDDAAADLDRAAVVRALDALTRHRRHQEGGATPKGAAMASRTRAYGRAAFNWAAKRGMVAANPFLGLPIENGSAPRERVLDDGEIAEIWRAIGEDASPYGSILKLLVLLGQRRGEVAGMTWGELSADLETWVIPGERTKNGIAHTVPIGEPVRALIRATLPGDKKQALRVFGDRRASNALVFPAAAGTVFSGWVKAKAALDQAIAQARAKAAAKAGTTAAPLVPWTVHDARRTVASGLQRLGIRFEVTESVLNHVAGRRGGVAGIYQRHDRAAEKRAALDAWAAHVLAIIEEGPAAVNTVMFARA